MDDIVIYANTLEEHAQKLRNLLARLKTAGLALQPDKCQFLRKEIAYLGHIITSEGVRPDSEKIKAVEKFLVPRTRKNVRQFLGLVGYYRRFISDFAKFAKPLNILLKKETRFISGKPQQDAFEIWPG